MRLAASEGRILLEQSFLNVVTEMRGIVIRVVRADLIETELIDLSVRE